MSSIIKYRNINVTTDDPCIIGNTVKKEVSATPQLSIEEQEDSLMDRLEKLSSKIEDAEKRYNEIVEESDKVIFETNTKAEKIIEEAKNDGMQKGYIEGKNKASEELQTMKLQIQDEYELKLQELDNEKKKFLQDTKNEISVIFRNAFTKVFENEIKYSNDLLEILIVKGLRELSDEKEVRVLLAEEDYRKLNKESLQRRVGNDFNDKHISVSFDKNLKNGSCLLETSLGFIDASLDNLANLVSNLIDNSIYEEINIKDYMTEEEIDNPNSLDNETNNIE